MTNSANIGRAPSQLPQCRSGRKVTAIRNIGHINFRSSNGATFGQPMTSGHIAVQIASSIGRLSSLLRAD